MQLPGALRGESITAYASDNVLEIYALQGSQSPSASQQGPAFMEPESLVAYFEI